MAEQEACATAVTDAVAGAAGTSEPASADETRGESLLLPLLQGLLGGGGERLLAGLGAAGADVVADVRRSLARLRAALVPPAAHPQAAALLALADRLDDALDAADRLDGCKRRPRRRARASRHTVGVTHEELQEARRLIDRNQLAIASRKDEAPVPAAPTSPPPTDPPATPVGPKRPPTPAAVEEVTNLEPDGSVTPEDVSFHDAITSRPKVAPIAHSPSYKFTPQVNRDAGVITLREPAPRKPDFFRHSIADATPPQQPILQPSAPRRPADSRTGIAAMANKFNAQIERETAPTRRAQPRQPIISAPIMQQKPLTQEEPKRAPLYQPLPPAYNFAAPPAIEDIPKPAARFSNSRRNRMKRANTIDIGKPLGGYRLDSDTDDEAPQHGPLVPEFRPQTENDKKFLAFMQRNDENVRGQTNGHVNWSNRFDNIKNTFESRDREDQSRSSSASSAKRFWQTTDDAIGRPPRRPFGEVISDRDRPRLPWATERRDPPRPYPPQLQAQSQSQSQSHGSRAPIAPPSPAAPQAPVTPLHYSTTPTTPPSLTFPPVPLAPTKPAVVKPFVAKPIPMNQFSHAPMSAFKPPKKIMSPTSASPHVWSPPSASILSPTEPALFYQGNSPHFTPSSPHNMPWAIENDKTKRVMNHAANKFEENIYNTQISQIPQPTQKTSNYNYTHATLMQPNSISPNYPVKSLPSQNNLAAPELVKKIETVKSNEHEKPFPNLDVQKSQIQFYEKQIREKNRHLPLTNGHRVTAARKPPAASAQPTYTVTDYTPANVVSTFVPLQRTPDIEKAKAHKVDYLPDVVMNENKQKQVARSPPAPRVPPGPRSPQAPVHLNGHTSDIDRELDDVEATEHCSVVTRVMRGPVCGAATITAGVRTRGEPSRAARGLHGALERVTAGREPSARPQVPHPTQNGHTPPSPSRPLGSPRSPASRDSLLTDESRDASPAMPLTRSESWHRVTEGPTSKSTSPRRIVSRAKSMHLLAIPKMFEGGIAREEVSTKQRTVEAYFSGRGGNGAGGEMRTRGSRSSKQAFSLGRSRTMPSVTELQFLDESNADDAFEDLVSALA